MKLFRDGILVEPEEAKEKKSQYGLIISGYMFDQFDRFKSNSSYGTVVDAGDTAYINPHDRVIFGHNTHWAELAVKGKKLLYFNREENILGRISAGGIFDIHPNYVLVKISQKDRDGLFLKKIKRDDGSEIELFVNVPASADEERYSKFFVQVGTVVMAGRAVSHAQAGDIAIIDYNLDNDRQIIIGYDGDDKLIVVYAATTRHQQDDIVYANRRSQRPRDQIISKKGDYDRWSQLLGVVRGDTLIANNPYIFLMHESAILHLKTRSGIMYSVKEASVVRTVLAISDVSKKRYCVSKGDKVLVLERDIFEVTIEGRKISVVNDVDIKADAGMLKQIVRQ